MSKEMFEKWFFDNGMNFTEPYTKQDLEKAYLSHAEEKKKILVDCLTSLKKELKGYNISGTVQGALTESDLNEIISKIKKSDPHSSILGKKDLSVETK